MKRTVLPLLFLAGCQASDPGPTVVVHRAPFTSALVERGQLVAATERLVIAPFDAKLDRLAEEGAVVAKGDVVGRLDTEAARDNHDKAVLKLQQLALKAPLAAVRADFEAHEAAIGLSNAEKDLAAAKHEYHLFTEERPEPQIVDVSQELGTLAAERRIVADTLPEAVELMKKGYMAPTEIQTMRRRLDELAAQRKALQAKLKVLEKGPRSDERSLKRLDIEEAAAARKAAEQRLKAATLARTLDAKTAADGLVRAREREAYRAAQLGAASLRAPAAGIVIREDMWTGGSLRKLDVGDAVDDGARLLTIADPADLEVGLMVHEASAAGLRVGMPVTCRFTAFPDLQLPGHVRQIAAVAAARLEDDLNHLQALAVRVALDPDGPVPPLAAALDPPPVRPPLALPSAAPRARLRPGMTAEVAFARASLPAALAVPLQAVGRDAKGPYVGVVAGRSVERRGVTLGPASATATVVLDGLVDGDRVLLHPPAAAGAPPPPGVTR